MIKAGDLVKIDDIGPLAQVLKKGRGRMISEIGWRGVLVSYIHYKKGGGVRR